MVHNVHRTSDHEFHLVSPLEKNTGRQRTKYYRLEKFYFSMIPQGFIMIISKFI